MNVSPNPTRSVRDLYDLRPFFSLFRVLRLLSIILSYDVQFETKVRPKKVKG